MIDPKLFTVEKLLNMLFDTCFGNRDIWRRQAEIIPQYMPPNPDAKTRPRCVVKIGDSFLRYSHGPRQGHMWDCYGDDYQTPELALMALLEAPIPPHMIRTEVWEEDRKYREEE